MFNGFASSAACKYRPRPFWRDWVGSLQLDTTQLCSAFTVAHFCSLIGYSTQSFSKAALKIGCSASMEGMCPKQLSGPLLPLTVAILIFANLLKLPKHSAEK